MDPYERLRNYPLNVVLGELGFEDWKWRKNGTEGYGRCPIHLPKKNSTSFSFDDSGRFQCFSCSAKGKGAIDLVMAIRHISFQEAISFLESVPGRIATTVSTPRPQGSPTPTVPGPSENAPFNASYEKFFKPHSWLEERGLSPGTLAHFEVGYYHNPSRRSAYNGSVMLKIRRVSDGECVGYLSRNIEEVMAAKPKYLFPKGVQKGLEVFGAWQIKNDSRLARPLRVCYLVESPFCVMKFFQLGFAAVSPFGWSVSPEQAAILAHLAKGYIYLPDRDKMNEIATSVISLGRQCWVKTPCLPDGVDDPENLTAEEIRALS